jgi:hypothetical protein
MEKGISTKSVPTQNVFTIKEDGTTTLVWGGKEDIQHVDALQAHLYTLLCQHLGPATTQDDKNKQNTLAGTPYYSLSLLFLKTPLITDIEQPMSLSSYEPTFQTSIHDVSRSCVAICTVRRDGSPSIKFQWCIRRHGKI